MRAAAGPVFVATVLLGASLVFLIQPMFAKMVLPRLGGGAGVWNVALVFFQGALLAGYIYANLLARTLPLRAQVGVHLALLALVIFTLPIAIADGFEAPPSAGAPQLWLIALFAASVGAPYAIVSATAPLMQAWFARTGHPHAANPYQLYAASNLGSLGALIAYPAVVEPLLGAGAQSLLWSGLYALLVVAIAACGAVVLASAGTAQPLANAVRAPAPAPSRIAPGTALSWMALAFAPSALLVGATTHISTDVAAAPLLWVAPLGLYLLAFSLAFGARTFMPMRGVLFAHAMAVALALALEFRPMGWVVSLPVTLGALFFGAFVCLRQVYQSRPVPEQLTAFYVYVSIGGVLGGGFAALAAPVLFNGVWEYPLALIATLLARPRAQEAGSAPALAIAAIALSGLAAFAAAKQFFGAELLNSHMLLAFALACAGVLMAHRTRWLLAGAAVIVAVGGRFLLGDVVLQERGFYGVAKVVDHAAQGYRDFQHGTTVHGVQSLDPALAHVPHGYYGAKTPIGQVFTRMNEVREVKAVAVLGLGAGAMACHKRPGQDWLMVEIDPIVARIAADPRYFTMVSTCAPDARIVIGDGRLELAKEPAGRFDLIFADAFSSDSVPTHLLTQEAVTMYLERLTPEGVLVMHVSNRVLELSAIVARTARAAGGEVLFGRYDAPAGDGLDRANFSSQVVIVSKTAAGLDPWRAMPGWREMPHDAGRPWTDNRSNILEALIAFWANPKAP